MVSKRSDGFVARESGAATFDWVILAVGVFGLGLAIYSVITADLGEQEQGAQTVIERSAPAPEAPVEATEATPAQARLPLLCPYHDAAWRAEQAAFFAGQSDAALLAAYDAQYAAATGQVNARIGMDFLAVIEAEMTRRGLPLPDGHEPAAAIHARLADAPAPP